MNDKPTPKTMMLSSSEWRTLVAGSASNLYSFISAMPSSTPSATELVWLHDVVDRMKIQVSAWGASGLQSAPMPDAPIRTEGEPVTEAWANGGGVTAAEPKKKRGWQKGRKRGPRKPKQGEAVQ